MAEITKIDDHYEEAVTRLPAQFKDKPNIDGMLQAMFSQIQDLENDFIDLRDNTKLLVAEGEQLDQYGKILGLIRDFDEPDGTFYGRIAQQVVGRDSDGSTDNLREVVESLTGLTDTNIIEFNNAKEWGNNSVPYLTGGVLLFGYYTDPNSRIHEVDVNIIQNACPITVSPTIFGKHLNLSGGNSLWIPCEVNLVGEPILLQDELQNLDNLVDNLGDNIIAQAELFDSFGDNWEQGILPEDDITFGELELTPSLTPLEVNTGSGTTNLTTATSGLGNNGVMLEIYTTETY